MKKSEIQKHHGIIALTILVFTTLAVFSFTNFGTTQADNLSVDCPNGPLRADLTGAATDGKTPGGMAHYKAKNYTGLAVMVQGVSVPDGTNLPVFVGNTTAGEILISKNGTGEAKFDSPTGISEGATISIKNAEATILSGTFICVATSPSPTATVNPTETPTLTPTPTR